MTQFPEHAQAPHPHAWHPRAPRAPRASVPPSLRSPSFSKKSRTLSLQSKPTVRSTSGTVPPARSLGESSARTSLCRRPDIAGTSVRPETSVRQPLPHLRPDARPPVCTAELRVPVLLLMSELQDHSIFLVGLLQVCTISMVNGDQCRVQSGQLHPAKERETSPPQQPPTFVGSFVDAHIFPHFCTGFSWRISVARRTLGNSTAREYLSALKVGRDDDYVVLLLWLERLHVVLSIAPLDYSRSQLVLARNAFVWVYRHRGTMVRLCQIRL